MNKYYTIYIDGIDKSGKDTIVSYLTYMGNHKYIVKSRGILSMIAYSKLYNRNYEYDLEPEKYVINVLVEVDKEDWEIRCKMTNEKEINYEENVKVFDEAYSECFGKIPLLLYNSTNTTPYYIAKDIIKKINEMEKKCQT